ncbi:chromosome partitioning protein ParB [Paraburkholderia sp. RG36]|uniref:Chromosome partitioning protein ParB n=1 Tax=Paraburkholderia tagetis TaxID=2913261 RepID=A0A9X1UGF3_9BURK|nr:ParB-like protein [Paraburkholderia tagetis]MCG5072923.1 chromosome partitioning protein ParB [Paraburkholderia tagetis]
MSSNTDLHLITVKLEELRPTQITVGFREVDLKRAHWKSLDKKGRVAAIDNHWFPAVLGPKQRYYVVDHHHLGLAWLNEGVPSARVTVIKDLSWLDPTIFWRMMEHNQWVHPFDAQGQRCDYAALPKQLTGLADDPYRSLAGELRGAGGYAKDTTPFSEFLWADYLRLKVDSARVQKDFNKALADALAHAHDPDARYLPGWSGVVPVASAPAATSATASGKGKSKKKG